MNKQMMLAASLALGALAAPQAAMAQDFDLMQFADSDGDNKVSPEEFAAFREQGWGFFAQGAAKMKVADMNPMAQGAMTGIPTDAEGNITHEAYTKAGPEKFKAADTNGDGSLSAEELMKAMRPA